MSVRMQIGWRFVGSRISIVSFYGVLLLRDKEAKLSPVQD